VRRREFITLLGGAAAWPLAARAQQPAGNRKIGLLHPGESTVVNMRVAAIREGLSSPENQRDSGVELVIRLADGDLSRLPALAEDLANNRVDVTLAAAPPAVKAAVGATTSIPVIAIDLESDPVASGFVTSLARPGHNVTGVFLDFPEFSAKCLQLLIESVPGLTGVGILWDPSTGSPQLKAVEAAAQGFSISAQVFETRRAADIAEAFYSLDRSRIQGVLLLSSPLIAGNPQLVADLAIRRKVPTISLFPNIAREGGLLGYGPDLQDLYRQIGAMARKVLQGAKVAELPAERPTRFQLVANLRTANLIGVTLPPSILLRADEVSLRECARQWGKNAGCLARNPDFADAPSGLQVITCSRSPRTSAVASALKLVWVLTPRRRPCPWYSPRPSVPTQTVTPVWPSPSHTRTIRDSAAT
jgi:putative ABC transport system substrate-binding protein